MKAFKTLMFALTLLVTGCTASETKPIDYGNPPSNYQSSIKAFFNSRLLEPETASYEFSAPVKASTTKGLIYGGGIAWAGYMVNAGIKAKNQMGGYSYSVYQIRFNGDQVYDVKSVH